MQEAEEFKERLVTPENTRLHQQKCIVGYLDGFDVADFSEAELVVENPVPVYGVDGKPIGHAALYVDKFRAIVADMSVDYATPERLEMESGGLLYAWPLGSVELAAGEVLSSLEVRLIDMAEPPKVARVQVGGVALRRQRPTDIEVPPVGTPVRT